MAFLDTLIIISPLVGFYFYYILMICQIVTRNYHLESLLMTRMCFTQMISYIILKQS